MTVVFIKNSADACNLIVPRRTLRVINLFWRDYEVSGPYFWWDVFYYIIHSRQGAVGFCCDNYDGLDERE